MNMQPLPSPKPNAALDATGKAPGETELAPLLTAWDQAHPDLADPEWRHLLDEIAHPRTTQAFYRLAEAAA
ncbi:hypothetical protein ACFY1L_35220 [Streptomyces sp. NPDC001663]|uniref:hypothetical protein n=1 Tax=Streptomyces sp. NPDC001663 TaxID=3364597 RepID=UPI0036BF1A8C